MMNFYTTFIILPEAYADNYSRQPLFFNNLSIIAFCIIIITGCIAKKDFQGTIVFYE
jgi:hypothetical protein